MNYELANTLRLKPIFNLKKLMKPHATQTRSDDSHRAQKRTSASVVALFARKRPACDTLYVNSIRSRQRAGDSGNLRGRLGPVRRVSLSPPRPHQAERWAVFLDDQTLALCSYVSVHTRP